MCSTNRSTSRLAWVRLTKSFFAVCLWHSTHEHGNHPAQWKQQMSSLYQRSDDHVCFPINWDLIARPRTPARQRGLLFCAPDNINNFVMKIVNQIHFQSNPITGWPWAWIFQSLDFGRGCTAGERVPAGDTLCERTTTPFLCIYTYDT